MITEIKTVAGDPHVLWTELERKESAIALYDAAMRVQKTLPLIHIITHNREKLKEYPDLNLLYG